MKKLEDFIAVDRIDLKLLECHTYLLNGEINEESVGACMKWLIFENLDSAKEKTLTIYINSTGGDLYQTFALIDVMRSSPHVIRCIGMGAVMSAAFLIFAPPQDVHLARQFMPHDVLIKEFVGTLEIVWVV